MNNKKVIKSEKEERKEMKKNAVKINVDITGMGREKNPHERLQPHQDHNIVNPDWVLFQESHKPYAAPGLPKGEHEAYLQWQYNRNDGSPNGKWTNIEYDIDIYRDIDIRQIWVSATPPVSKEEGKTAEELAGNVLDMINEDCDACSTRTIIIKAMQAYADQQLSSQKAALEQIAKELEVGEYISAYNIAVNALNPKSK